MARIILTRDFYIPAGAVRVRHKASSAVAYLYPCRNRDGTAGRPAAMVFAGKQQKPAWRAYFDTDAIRAQRVGAYFAAIEAQEARQAERRAERAAKGRGVDVGDVLMAMWGYDQTNIDYYEIVGLVGKTMVEIRAIAAEREETEWQQGKSVPAPGRYIGEVMRRVAKDGRVKIDDVRSAGLVEPMARIGGKAVYKADHWTAYH